MVGEERDHVGLAAQHIIHKALERLLRPDLDKGAHTIGVQRFETLDPLHRRGDLLLQQVFDAFHVGRVELASHVRHEWELWRADAQAVQHLAQRLACRRDDPGMEGVTDRDALGLEALLGEDLNRLLDGLARAADHRLPVAVDVRGHHVAVDLLQRRLYHVERGHHGGHPAVVAHADLGHLAAARGGGFQRVGQRHNTGSGQRGVLAQRVAHHHVGAEAVLSQQPRRRRVERQHGWLRDRGLHQVALGLLHSGRVGAIHKNVAGQRAAQDGRHHAVGLVENGFDGGRNAS